MLEESANWHGGCGCCRFEGRCFNRRQVMKVRTRNFWDRPVVRFDEKGPCPKVWYDLRRTAGHLSEERLKRLDDFIRSYVEANGSRMRRVEAITACSAGWFRVLREHAEEMAARILVHITDPCNRDPLLREVLMMYEPEAHEYDEETRARIAEKWPELVDDPLGTVPVSEQGMGLDRLCRL